jgi:hypothetical protein
MEAPNPPISFSVWEVEEFHWRALHGDVPMCKTQTNQNQEKNPKREKQFACHSQ